ncbi:hypothetical protein RFI_18976 [Reticulomyxa filosa]|uniref:Uncharacterized protein n=1 Tax=Reticulomyxa filosa TaxID=46433 RepID=X6MXT5_RETFI|nr:hypothetical protein RFI_18976 [Reticulomyxa filosa]|eukprot:ETO18302.1 hypothetical protein RFI_18976 [Reticulomyxa filosa]
MNLILAEDIISKNQIINKPNTIFFCKVALVLNDVKFFFVNLKKQKIVTNLCRIFNCLNLPKKIKKLTIFSLKKVDSFLVETFLRGILTIKTRAKTLRGVIERCHFKKTKIKNWTQHDKTQTHITQKHRIRRLAVLRPKYVA